MESERVMKYVVVDLEMNWLASKYKIEREFCEREIIEIGAVVLDEKFQEIDKFKTYVKPQFNDVISKSITNLTKITTEMVKDAPVFEEAIKMFFDWCNKQEDDLQFIQWSESDLIQMVREVTLKHIELDESVTILLKEWYDLQKECGSKLNLENSVSLKNAVMYAGLEFEGKEHDALDDARMTAILMKILRIPELFKNALEKVKEALTPKEIGTSLGDLFDFSALAISA